MNYKLRTMEPYAGKVSKESVVQLLVYSLETENAPLSAPVGISADGDFYFAVLSENIVYQIHKNGRLIRAYAADYGLVEETIMEAPMAVLAMLQGKILLSGAFLSVRDAIYVFLGETKSWENQGLIYKDAVLIAEGGEGWQGVPRSYPGYEAAQSLEFPKLPKLKGILVVRHNGKENEILPMEPRAKKELLLENFVGFSLLSQDLKQYIRDSESMNKICDDIPVSILMLREECAEQAMVREDILKLISFES